MTQEEIVNKFIQTMQAHAEPRDYDWAILLVAIASIAVSGYAIWFTRRIYKKQTKISERQTEIAAQQNKIALFEKRYEVYSIYSTIKNTAELFNRDKTLENVKIQCSNTGMKKFSFWFFGIGIFVSESVRVSINDCFSEDFKYNIEDDLKLRNTIIVEIAQCLSALEQIEFLYELDDEKREKLNQLIGNIKNFSEFGRVEKSKFGKLQSDLQKILDSFIDPSLYKTITNALFIHQNTPKN